MAGIHLNTDTCNCNYSARTGSLRTIFVYDYKVAKEALAKVEWTGRPLFFSEFSMDPEKTGGLNHLFLLCQYKYLYNKFALKVAVEPLQLYTFFYHSIHRCRRQCGQPVGARSTLRAPQPPQPRNGEVVYGRCDPHWSPSAGRWSQEIQRQTNHLPRQLQNGISQHYLANGR